MRIERIVVKKLRALQMREDHLVLSGRAWPSACLRGVNGSGKTTWLEMVAQLWQWFRRCARKGYMTNAKGSPLLEEATLCGMLLTDLPGPQSKVWIVYGSWEQIEAHCSQEAGFLPIRAGNSNLAAISDTIKLLEWWDRAFTLAESGQDPVPNIVYLEAENKWVPELRRDELASTQPTPAYHVLGRYLPSERGASHLEGLLRTLRLAYPEKWNNLKTWIPELFPGLSLLDNFDDRTSRPQFQLPNKDIIFLNHLSAGERSVLINLCTLLRWLTPGGIVLLDEPELHQHLSLMRSSLEVLEWLIVDALKGQLIVASHSPEVWASFQQGERFIRLEGRT